MVIQKNTTGHVSRSRANLDRYVSPSLSAKLGLLIAFMSLSAIAYVVGLGMVAMIDAKLGVIFFVISGVLLLVSAVLQIGAWVLFGRKIDQIEAAVSANAGHVQDLYAGVAKTNQILGDIHELCLQALYPEEAEA